ncbi:MAG TPA: RluA family pseudouridine synthase, partial [bacterium]|nr:RluA family pseudouridine synthase [bacterium]
MSEKTTLQTKITSAAAGQALLDYMAGRFRYQPRDHWERMIQEGALTLNGQKAEPGLKLKAGDRLAYEVVLAEPPVDKNIQILHEEDAFLVAEKPAHLPSHADGNFIQNTFIHLVGQALKARGFGGKARLVHRLDRETSGLMVVAKTRDAARLLSGQFEKAQVEKNYWAIVQGRVEKDRFEVSGAIGPDGESQISLRRKILPAEAPGAQGARTLFEVVRRLQDATLVLCRPQTGRTGQIRVHLASLGHPLVNDKLYGRSDGQFLEFVRQSKRARPEGSAAGLGPRHFLHAGRLSFDHPLTGQR